MRFTFYAFWMGTLLLALLAILVLGPLFYLPGLLIAAALLGAAQPTDMLERHYERAVIGALLNGWLAFTLAEIGVFSAWLHVMLLVLICIGAASVAVRRGALRWPGSRGTPPLGIVALVRPATDDRAGYKGRPPAAGAWRSTIGGWDTLAFALVGALFAVLVARPFEVVLGVRDAGVYANIGFAIARTGAIVQYDELVAQIGQDQQSSDAELRAAAAQAETNFLGVQHPERTIATRLRSAGFYIHAGELASGRVVPQFFHLYPAWIGLLAALFGLHGGLLATGVLGLLGVWSVGMLGRRLAGAWVGLLAMLFLALNGVQIWFSRYSTSEAAVQFLTFAGLYFFAVLMSEREATNDERQTTHDSAPDDSAFRTRRSTFAALFAGVAFGQVALTRIDFVLVVGPLLVYLFYTWLTRRWTRVHAFLAGGLGAMLLHAALHVVFIARAYFFDTLYARLQDFALSALVALPFLTPTLRTYYLSRATSKIGIRLGPGEYLWNWQRIALETVVLLLVLAGVWALRRWGQPLLVAAERAVLRRRHVLVLLAVVGIVTLAVYGYLVRPRILTPERLAALPGCLTPAQLRQPGPDCLALQGYIGAPIAVPTDLRDLFAIPLANMVRVGWYLSPLGIVLGVAGFAMWWWRGLNRASWLFLTTGLLATVFFVRQSYGSSDQSYIYILRRYVPQVYPTLSLGIAYALVGIANFSFLNYRARQSQIPNLKSKIGAGIAATLTIALVGFMVLTNRVIYQHVEYGGVLTQLQTIARRFGPRDVLLFHSGSRDEPDLVATPLKYAFGVDAFTIKSSRPDRYAPQLAHYVQHWQEQGRTVYMMFGPSGGFGLPELRLEPAGRIALEHLAEFEQLQDQKPHNVQDFNLDFAAYQLLGAGGQPANQVVTVTPEDYAAQAGGMYRAEQIGGVNLAWTQGDALLRLPWPDGNAHEITIALAGGVRSATLGPAQVCMEFWPEANYRMDPPEAIAGDLGCFELAEQMRDYTLTIDPQVYADIAPHAILLRIRTETWVPAQVDPSQTDRRTLGVQFGSLVIK